MTHDARSWASALLLEGGDAPEARASALEAISHALIARGDQSLAPIARFFDDPNIAAAAKEEALAAIVPGDEVWAAFTALVVSRRASSMIPAIAIAYRRGLDERTGTVRVAIESARPLDAAIKDSIIGAWRAARSGSLPDLACVVSEVSVPELIGGFRLKSGSIRYDASIAGRLKRLESELARPLERSRESRPERPATGSGGQV